MEQLENDVRKIHKNIKDRLFSEGFLIYIEQPECY